MASHRPRSVWFDTLSLTLTTLAVLLNLRAVPRAALAQVSEQQLFVSVIDRKGQAITDLAPEEISVQEDGVTCAVRFLTPAAEPADVAILVDTSGAVVSATAHIREALHAFVSMLDGRARMSLMTFGDLPRRQVAPTFSVHEVREGISRLFPSAGSFNALQDALVQTVLDFRDRQPGRPTVVVITSSNAPSSVRDATSREPKSFLAFLKASGAPIHIVALTARSALEGELPRRGGTALQRTLSGPREAVQWQEILETASNLTGGRFESVMASSGIGNPLRGIAQEISHQYVLTYVRPAPPKAPEDVKIRVRIKRRGVDVHVAPVP